MEVALDIPLPRKKAVSRVYPWHTMEVGASFVIPLNPASAYSLAHVAGIRYAPRKFACRKHEGEMRCWRVA